MLRDDLKDSDIPHRTTIRNQIMQLLDEHLDLVEAEIAVRAQVELSAYHSHYY
jgi:hypothetical protein